MELEKLLQAFVANIGNKAGHEFWGVENSELAEEIESQYQEALGLGVSESLLEEILETADYTEGEDGGASSEYVNAACKALIAKALVEAEAA